MLRAPVAVLSLLLWCLPAPALAGTVTFAQVPCAAGFCPEVRFDGAGSERNLVRVFRDGVGLLVRDDESALAASGGCAQVARNLASCPAGQVLVVTGEGDDELLASGVEVQVLLGPGNDECRCGGTVAGGPGDDLLVGRSGDDRLFGGPGRDDLRGGDGADVLFLDDLDGTATDPAVAVPGAQVERPAADSARGGRGRDRISYERRSFEGVEVQLGRGTRQGSEHEGDRVAADVENLRGSRNDDTLVGDLRANTIEGAAGSDAIEGRGGGDRVDGALANGTLGGGFADRIFGGNGADRVIGSGNGSRLSGGRGNDVVVTARAVSRASITCGAGRDRYSGRLRRPADCERR